MISKNLSKQQIAKRCAQDIQDGSYVNLGIGIPTLVSNYIENKEVLFQSENGILGSGERPAKGEEDLDLVNVSAEPITLVQGGVFVNHVDSFAMIRGGHLDISIMGSFQVAENGDLANWITDPDAIPGIGGAMDLAKGSKKVFVTMNHVTKNGDLKILKKCNFPLTASGVVKRIFTDLAVIDVSNEGLILKELVPGISIKEIQELTEAELIIKDKVLTLNP